MSHLASRSSAFFCFFRSIACRRQQSVVLQTIFFSVIERFLFLPFNVWHSNRRPFPPFSNGFQHQMFGWWSVVCPDTVAWTHQQVLLLRRHILGAGLGDQEFRKFPWIKIFLILFCLVLLIILSTKSFILGEFVWRRRGEGERGRRGGGDNFSWCEPGLSTTCTKVIAYANTS